MSSDNNNSDIAVASAGQPAASSTMLARLQDQLEGKLPPPPD
jgi:hypothetical protein